jgi:membrane associated rhomboid family serine protease
MVFIPIADDNPKRWIRYHYVTFGIVAACVAVFLLQLSGGERGFEISLYAWGVIPSVLLGPW